MVCSIREAGEMGVVQPGVVAAAVGRGVVRVVHFCIYPNDGSNRMQRM